MALTTLLLWEQITHLKLPNFRHGFTLGNGLHEHKIYPDRERHVYTKDMHFFVYVHCFILAAARVQNGAKCVNTVKFRLSKTKNPNVADQAWELGYWPTCISNLEKNRLTMALERSTTLVF